MTINPFRCFSSLACIVATIKWLNTYGTERNEAECRAAKLAGDLRQDEHGSRRGMRKEEEVEEAYSTQWAHTNSTAESVSGSVFLSCLSTISRFATLFTLTSPCLVSLPPPPPPCPSSVDAAERVYLLLVIYLLSASVRSFGYGTT